MLFIPRFLKRWKIKGGNERQLFDVARDDSIVRACMGCTNGACRVYGTEPGDIDRMGLGAKRVIAS